MQTAPNPLPDLSTPRDSYSRAGKILFAIGVVAISLYLGSKLAFARMFFGFQLYDDEGASLMTLDQLARGHALYNQITTMYGPFGFLPKLAVVKLFHLPVNHDTGRALSLILWLTISFSVGATAWKLASSVAWFPVASLATVIVLDHITHEPGHPQDICGTLLAGAVLLAALCKGKRITLLSIAPGILAAFLCMTKINLGAFCVAALGSAMLCQMQLGRARIGILISLAVVAAACPFALMYDNLAQSWCAFYAIQTSIALLACVLLATFSRAPLQFQPKHLLWCAVGWFAGLLLVIAVSLALGTTLAGLYEGIIHLPIVVSAAFVGPFPATTLTMFIALIGVAAAMAAIIYFRRNEHPSKPVLAAIAIARIALPVIVLYQVNLSHREFTAPLAPAFAWLLLLPVESARDAKSFPFSRLFLALVAIFESMWAYPMCGTQLDFSTFLLVLIAIITLADGIKGLTFLLPIQNTSNLCFVRMAISLVVVGLAFFRGWNLETDSARQYAQSPSLNLPGSELIHVTDQDIHLYPLVTANLQQNADVFYTAPGLCSYYFWTQSQPPTPATATGWIYILTDQQQEQIIAVLDQHPRACFMFVPELIDFWMQGKQMPSGPLVRYFNQQFRHAYDVFGAQIWVRKDRKSVDIVNSGGSINHLVLPALD